MRRCQVRFGKNSRKVSQITKVMTTICPFYANFVRRGGGGSLKNDRVLVASKLFQHKNVSPSRCANIYPQFWKTVRQWSGYYTDESQRQEFLKKYYVHPETIEFFKARQADNVQPYYDIGVVEARKQSIIAAVKYAGNVNLEGTETEFIIPSPHCKDGIPVTVYKPSSCEQLAAPGILLYYHGGGNTVGCRKTHETVCKIIARDTPCIVVNVEYRLAPEHKFPANIDDSVCAVQWVAANKTTIGGKSNSKLGVSGDSAGGKLAAIVCHEATDSIDFAVLVYPSVSYATVYPSHKEFEDGPVLSKPVMTWFTSQYITEADKSNPRASVILNKDFSYLPPTQIIVADLDPLRDGCYAYYEKLKEAGVKVELKTIKGVPHAFWSLPVAYKETCGEAHAAAVKFIKDNCYSN